MKCTPNSGPNQKPGYFSYKEPFEGNGAGSKHTVSGTDICPGEDPC
jgi:hypothetical protein